MKVLIDSVVWSLALRRKSGAAGLNPNERRLVAVLGDAVKDGRVVIIGPIRQEVLSGVKHLEQLERLHARLALFPDQAVEATDYVDAARLDHLCQRFGVKCGAVDMLICAVAKRNEWTILTVDSGLLRCIAVVEKEGFAKEEKMSGRKLRDAACDSF